MKHMLLTCDDLSGYESWPGKERQALFAEVDVIMTELRESGSWSAGWPVRGNVGGSR